MEEENEMESEEEPITHSPFHRASRVDEEDKEELDANQKSKERKKYYKESYKTPKKLRYSRGKLY